MLNLYEVLFFFKYYHTQAETAINIDFTTIMHSTNKLMCKQMGPTIPTSRSNPSHGVKSLCGWRLGRIYIMTQKGSWSVMWVIL